MNLIQYNNMDYNENYTFNVSLSLEKFPNKEISNAMISSMKKHPEYKKIRRQYGFKPNKGVSFKIQPVTCRELLDYLLEGHCFCHVFTVPTNRLRCDGTFGASCKTNDNFNYSQVIGVDVDHTSYPTAEQFIDKLTLKPSLYYTSYRNLVDGNGARFRLIYVFSNRIESIYMFRFLAIKLKDIILQDTGECKSNDNWKDYIDECSIRPTQYFNGTCRTNPDIILSYGITNNIYSLSDIGYSEEEYRAFLIGYCNYESYNKNHVRRIEAELYGLKHVEYRFNRKANRFELPSDIYAESRTEQDIFDMFQANFQQDIPEYNSTTENVLNKWNSLRRNTQHAEFKKYSEWNRMRNLHRYHYRKEKPEWIHGLYQFIDSDYFALKYYLIRIEDNMKRRKKLYDRMCLRRIMYPTINRDEMVFDTLIDIMKFFDNEDGIIDKACIKRNIECCFTQDIESLKEHYAEYIAYLQQFNPKRGIIYKNRKCYSKETTYLILDDYYNPELSVRENMEFINAQLPLFTISQSTLSRYLKDRGYKADIKKLTEIELRNMIDSNRTGRENHRLLKQQGYKVGLNRIQQALKAILENKA